MNANQLINALTWAELDGSLEPDTRRMLRAEREALQVSARSGDKSRISSAITEVKRVADMWGVELESPARNG